MGGRNRRTQRVPVDEDSSRSLDKLLAAGVLLILSVTAVAYLPVVGNDFVNFDDHVLIVENPIVKELSWGGVAASFRQQLYTPHYKPLVYLSWMVEYRLFGPNPVAYHLNNLALHLANTSLVFFIVLRLGRWSHLSSTARQLLALFSALLFGVHPLHVESVAWAVERKDMLFAFFYLLAAFSYITYAQGSFRDRWLVAVSASCYLLSILSKSMAITFAIVPFLIDGMARRRYRWVASDKVAFLAVLLAACFLYGLPGGFGGTDQSGGPLTWALISNYRLLAFAGHLAFPFHLSIVYPAEHLLNATATLLPVLPLVTIAIAITLFLGRNQWSAVGAGCLFFVLSISPALAMSGSGTNFLSDRYTYVPSLGLLVAGVYVVLRFTGERRMIPIALLATVALFCGVLSFQRCQVWRDSETLWSDAIDKFPGTSHVAYVNRGNFFFEQGNYVRALRDYEQALELSPLSAMAYKNRGSVYARRGDLVGALGEFDAAIELDPTFSEAYLHRGMTLTLLGRYRQAEEDYEQYLAVVAVDAKAYFWRGLNRQGQDRHPEAVADFRRAIELNPAEERYEAALERSISALRERKGGRVE